MPFLCPPRLFEAVIFYLLGAYTCLLGVLRVGVDAVKECNRVKYNNAKDMLPEWLLKQIQLYIQGEVVYIPIKKEVRAKWGEANGTRKLYMKRNMEIVNKYINGARITDLSVQYSLSEHSIKKILTGMKKVI